MFKEIKGKSENLNIFAWKRNLLKITQQTLRNQVIFLNMKIKIIDIKNTTHVFHTIEKIICE